MKYTVLLQTSAEKDAEIAALKQKLSLEKPPQQHEQQQSNIDLMAYHAFFTDAQLNELENMYHQVRNDASFVRKIIWFLYDDRTVDDIPTLRKRFKNGNVINSKIMPEEICCLIKGMLSLRLEKTTKTNEEYLYRLERTNYLISQGLLMLIKSKEAIAAQDN